MDSNAYGAIGAAVAATIQGLSQIGNSRLNLSESKALAAYQNDLAIQNWQMQNEYNSPVNQMARLEEAGINPNLAYSNGSITNTTSSAPDAHNVAETPNYHLDKLIPNAMQTISSLLALQSQASENETKEYQAEFMKWNLMDFITDYYTKWKYDGNTTDMGIFNPSALYGIGEKRRHHLPGLLIGDNSYGLPLAMAQRVAKLQNDYANLSNIRANTNLAKARTRNVDLNTSLTDTFGSWERGSKIAKTISSCLGDFASMFGKNFRSWLDFQKYKKSYVK